MLPFDAEARINQLNGQIRIHKRWHPGDPLIEALRQERDVLQRAVDRALAEQFREQIPTGLTAAEIALVASLARKIDNQRAGRRLGRPPKRLAGAS